MTYLLGIDVGTTRTAAAIFRPGARTGEAEIVNLGDRSSAVPSVLFLGADGGVLVGDAAERRAATDPDRVVREFKRRIGDPTPLNVAGRAWPAQELAARLVRWVIDRVAEREGGPASRIAITHPASWGAHKKDLFGAALAGQGVKVVFLAEPQAAALHYASAERVERGSTIAVYDLGGGTFDAAVVHKDSAAGFTLIGRPEGLERLGGIDFDQAVFDHVRAGMPGVFDTLDDTDPAVLSAVTRIRRDCTEAKEALSSDTEVSIPVLLPESRGSVRLHRSEFEALIQPQVEDTVAALRRAIGSAGLDPEKLTTVLLVGGSSRIPLVAQLVSDQLGRPVAVDADPKNAIAKGAALALTPTGVSATGANPARPPAVPPQHGPGVRPIGLAAGAGGGAVAVAGVAGVPYGGPPVPRAGGYSPAPPPRPAAPALYNRPPVASGGYASAADTVANAGGGGGGGRRSPAALITIGGLFAAALVVAALLLLPRSDPGTAQNQSPIVTPAPTAPPTASPPKSATKPPPAPATQRPAPARPVPPRTTPPPVSTTAPPPTTTPPVTTTPPPPPPPPDPDPGPGPPPDPDPDPGPDPGPGGDPAPEPVP